MCRLVTPVFVSVVAFIKIYDSGFMLFHLLLVSLSWTYIITYIFILFFAEKLHLDQLTVYRLIWVRKMAALMSPLHTVRQIKTKDRKTPLQQNSFTFIYRLTLLTVSDSLWICFLPQETTAIMVPIWALEPYFGLWYLKSAAVTTNLWWGMID